MAGESLGIFSLKVRDFWITSDSIGSRTGRHAGCDRDCEWPSTSKAATVSPKSLTVFRGLGMRGGSRFCLLEVSCACVRSRRSSIASGWRARASASLHRTRPQHGARRFRPASSGYRSRSGSCSTARHLAALVRKRLGRKDASTAASGSVCWPRGLL